MKKLLYLFKPLFVIRFIICKIRSFYYTWKYIDEGDGKIIFMDPFIKVNITKQKTSVLKIAGRLKIIPQIVGANPISIQMSSNSRFEINDDFIIGYGVKIALMQNSSLIFGGKEIESESGITADTIIMVYKKIEIGKDFLCAWNVFITDSDWHQIKGQHHQSDTIIGNHVWIANSNNILKGSVIGNNCIVASNSKTINQNFPDDALIGGVPAKVLKTGVEWKRDISKSNKN
jgi:acetyltransferase-like isoleucine patch superfamily enzyme